MTPRSIRRAQERKANKLARKAARQIAPDLSRSPDLPELPPSFDLPKPPTQSPERSDGASDYPGPSPAQLAANRANAQLSTGAKTPEGKAKSSLNAVKTALTGRTVLLPAEDAAQYEAHLQAFKEDIHPIGPRECAIAQSLADNSWRLDRIPALEMAIFAKGRIQFANDFDREDVSLRPGLIELHTFLTYEKQLRNLQLQEARLHRRREKDTAELRQLQQERDKREKDQLDIAAKTYLAARHDNKPFVPAEFGFEFSIAEIERYLEGARAANIARATMTKEHDLVIGRAKAA